MRLPRIKLKPAYSQEQIKEQMAIVRDLIEQRDKLATSMSERNGEYNRATQAVESAQEVLNFYLDEVNNSGRK